VGPERQRCSWCGITRDLTPRWFPRNKAKRSGYARECCRCRAVRSRGICRRVRLESLQANPPVVRPLREIVRESICEAVEICGGVPAAADALGISRGTIYRRLAEWSKLPPPPLPRVEAWRSECERMRREQQAAIEELEDIRQHRELHRNAERQRVMQAAATAWHE
jgi:hypothetical protein